MKARRLDDLALLRRIRDRIDREYAQPLDVEELARGAHMSAGRLSRPFRSAYTSVNLATRDLDDVFARPQAGGVEAAKEPTGRPYGIRDCAFRDRAGSLLRIQELR